MNASCSVPISMSHWTAYHHLMYLNLSIVHSCLNMKSSKDKPVSVESWSAPYMH